MQVAISPCPYHQPYGIHQYRASLRILMLHLMSQTAPQNEGKQCSLNEH